MAFLATLFRYPDRALTSVVNGLQGGDGELFITAVD